MLKLTFFSQRLCRVTSRKYLDLDSKSAMVAVDFVKSTLLSGLNRFQVWMRTSSRNQMMAAKALMVSCGVFLAQTSLSTRCDQNDQLKGWLSRNNGFVATSISIEQIHGRGYGMVNRGGALLKKQRL